jgi:hypothetical protein
MIPIIMFAPRWRIADSNVRRLEFVDPAVLDRSAMTRSSETAPRDRLDHPAFPQPDRVDRSVWHYMTLAKFISLLDTSSLFFCRLDCLDDPYEGAPEARWRRAQGKRAKATEETRALRMSCFVNCWNLSDYESEALWRLYGSQEASVAIRSTYDRLVEVLDRNQGVYLGLIRYCEHQAEALETTDRLARVMHKSRAFRHEEEVRFVWALDRPDEERAGVDFPVDLDRLVCGIYIDPYAPEWFEKVVQAVVSRFAPALADRITWSSMKAEPLY